MRKDRTTLLAKRNRGWVFLPRAFLEIGTEYKSVELNLSVNAHKPSRIQPVTTFKVIQKAPKPPSAAFCRCSSGPSNGDSCLSFVML